MVESTRPTSWLRGLGIEQLVLLMLLMVFPLDALVSIGGGSTVQQSEGITLTRLCTAALIGLCAWQALWRRDTGPLRLPFQSAVSVFSMIFIGATLLSLTVSRTPHNALGPTASRLAILAYYLLVLLVVRDRKTLELCVIVYAIVSVFASTAGLYEMLSHQPLIEEFRYSESIYRSSLESDPTGHFRIQGLSREPDAHAAQLLMQVGLLLYALFRFRSWWWRIFAAVVLALAVANVVASSSRAAWLGLAITMGAFALLVPLKHKAALLAGAAGVLVLAFVAVILCFPQLSVLDRLLSRSRHGSFATRFRIDMARVSIEMGKQNPVLGVGTGNFRQVFPKAARVAPFLPRTVIYAPHNAYLAVFAENGVVGLIPYCLMHLAIAIQLVLCWQRTRDWESKLLVVGLIAGFVSFIYAISWYPMEGSKYGWTIVGFIGALTVLLRRQEQDAAASQGLPIRAQEPAIVSANV